jgi:hypothetical protein
MFGQLALIFFGTDTKWLAWLSVLNLNLVDSGKGSCIAPFTPMTRLLTGLFMPVVFFALLWLSCLFRILLLYILACCTKLPRPRFSCTTRSDESTTTLNGSGNENAYLVKSTKTSLKGAEEDPSVTVASSSSDTLTTSSTRMKTFIRPLPSSSCQSRLYSLYDQLFDTNLVPRYIRASTSLFIFSYTSISDCVFKFLDCTAVGEGASFVTTMPSISCQSSAYRSLFPFILILLIVVVVVSPVALAVWLWRCKLQHKFEKLDFAMKYGVL